MKAVMLSLRPEWCKKIFEGEKTIEVRRTRPLIDMPFKVYVYETKARFVKCVRGACTKYGYGSGKVIGSFVCDKIDEYEANERGWYIYPQDETCLLCDEIAHYGKGKPLYGWHITEPTLFDKPRDIKEFALYGKCAEDCDEYDICARDSEDGRMSCKYFKRTLLKRPPQSYCFVETDER